MTGRLRALDGLRGLLALYILAAHTMPFLDLPGRAGWAGSVLSHGRGAVELFFVLSGMVILRSLGPGFERISATRFLVARAGRLLPVYAVALALAVLALSCGNPFTVMPWLSENPIARNIAEAAWPHPWLAHLAAHITLTQGLLPPALLPDVEFTLLGPAWSLSTEWQFYLVVAAVLALRRRPHADVDANDGSRVLAVMMLVGVIGLLCDLLPPQWQPGRAFLPHEAWYFALGIASAGLCAPGRTRATGWWWGLALAAAGLLQWQQTPLTASVVPLLWTACLVCETTSVPIPFRPLARALNARPLQWFAGISYPLYLTHLPIQRLLMLAMAPMVGQRWGLFNMLWGPVAMLIPLLVAYALHRWVEVPCWRWSRDQASNSLKIKGFLVFFFKRERKALLFAKRGKNSHPFMDGG
jgi:peptidoglycan/LPS O-acetylase OafA/YrhL